MGIGVEGKLLHAEKHVWSPSLVEVWCTWEMERNPLGLEGRDAWPDESQEVGPIGTCKPC